MKQLVVVGNGMAGVACVEQILKHKHDFEITIFGDETHVNYNRILLSWCWRAKSRPKTSSSTTWTGTGPTTSARGWACGSSISIAARERHRR